MNTAPVLDFQVAKDNANAAKKEAELQAEAEQASVLMVSKALLGVEGEKPLSTEAVMITADLAEKIVSYSGDVEFHGSRKTSVCSADRLVKAASNQRYWVKDTGLTIRIEFDGDYFYDLYLRDTVDQVFKATILEALEAESLHNFNVTNYNNAKLMAAIL